MKVPNPLNEALQDLKPVIEAALDRASEPEDGCPALLGEAIRYSLLAPGKRLRPSLVLMAAEACGGTVASAMPAAVAVEMVHAYSLIHDDLPAMDDDDLRRGRPTCHIRYGEAMAILAGDALLARAFEVLSSGLDPAERARDAVVVLARAAGATALVGGQADDLAAGGDGDPSLAEGSEEGAGGEAGEPRPGPDRVPIDALEQIDHLESIHRRKTGALFHASVALGAIASGGSLDQRSALAEYAEGLGLAFQIVDDLLDWEGSADQVGKRTGKDAALGKLTFPGLLGVDESRRRAEELVVRACRAAESLGSNGGRLAALARYVIQRSR